MSRPALGLFWPWLGRIGLALKVLALMQHCWPWLWCWWGRWNCTVDSAGVDSDGGNCRGGSDLQL